MVYGHQCITLNLGKEIKALLEAWDSELVKNNKKQFIIFYDLKDFNNWIIEAEKQKIMFQIFYIDDNYNSSLDN